MKIGAYENSEKSLMFANIKEYTSLYFDLNTFGIVEGERTFFYNKISFKNIPLPTIECLKERYEVGDKVYFQFAPNYLLYGTITGKRDPWYIIDHCMGRTPRRIIPYRYYSLHSKCRLAIHWWFLISRRFGVVKDIRKLIGSYIWRLRNEYEWDCNHKHTLKRLAHKKIKYSE
jgi:hypothetical protein